MNKAVLTALAVAAALVLAPSPGATQDDFVPGFEDLPLAPGLTGDPDGGVGIDTPSGRILESEATGRTPAADVRAFYDATLPQLGWHKIGADTWVREGERLTIDVVEATPTAVRFTVAPQ